MERLRAGKRTGRAHLSLDCISIGSNAKQGEKGPTKLRRRWEEEKRGAASGRQVALEASRAFHTAPGSLSLSGLATADDGKSEAIDSALTSSGLLNSHSHYSTLQSSSPPYSQTPRPLHRSTSLGLSLVVLTLGPYRRQGFCLFQRRHW